MFKTAAKKEKEKDSGSRREDFFNRPQVPANTGSIKLKEHFSDTDRFIKWVESYINNIV